MTKEQNDELNDLIEKCLDAPFPRIAVRHLVERMRGVANEGDRQYAELVNDALPALGDRAMSVFAASGFSVPLFVRAVWAANSDGILYRIWSNEHNAWWKHARNGYTEDMAEAGIYPRDEALSICREANRFNKSPNVPNEAMVPMPMRDRGFDE